MKEFNIAEYLSNHGINVSFQRMKIFEYFVKFKGHPTVNDIYNYVINEVPTLSKTTVYNTLNLFVESGVIDVITIEENETRYDWGQCVHGHFKCNDCGEVMDINFDTKKLIELMPDLIGNKITEHHVNFKGICKNCLSKVKKI